MFKKGADGELNDFCLVGYLLGSVLELAGWFFFHPLLLFIPSYNTKSNIVLGKLNYYARVKASTLWRFMSWEQYEV